MTHDRQRPPHTPHAGPYPLLARLGEGGSGAVYRSLSREQPPRPVALKLLAPRPGLPPAWDVRADLLPSLRHPHLVAVLACGRIDSQPFVEMELVAGPSLRDRLAPGQPLPTREALALVAQLGGALSYLHARGLLHLDVKPDNVLCPAAGACKLADLDGVVPRGDDRLAWERGSPDYCAPEQRYGLPVDERADLFALAGVAYEMLTGAVPGRIYVPCSRHAPALAGAVDDVLRQARARDRFDRPARVADFVARLRQAADSPAPAHAPTARDL